MPTRARWAHWSLPLAPAYLAGTYLAGLLFFLNPNLPFSIAALASGTLYYGTLAAPLSLAAHLLIARWGGQTPARIVPWSLTAVAVAAAIGDGVHASVYAFLLPSAINRQLIKSALWLGFAALLIFYTALLHALHRRRYGPRSRWFIALVALGSVYAMVDRRTSYRSPAPDSPSIAVDAETERPRLVVVAVPGLSPDAVLPLARRGRLPFFSRLLERGAEVRLESPTPAREVALWAEWATGKLPFQHEIIRPERWTMPLFGRGARLSELPILWGFERWGLPGGRAVELRREDRAALSAWEILERIGASAEAAGFPAWLSGAPPPAPATVEPSAAARELAALGREELARALEDDRARLEAARQRLAAPGAPDAYVLLLPGFETAARSLYAGFSAVNFDGRRSPAATAAARAFELYLGTLDAELSGISVAVPEPRVLAISSPYGISAPRGVARLGRALAGSELELRGRVDEAADGILLLDGPGVRPGAQVDRGQLVDLVPTLLYAVGSPLARDFDGRVLTEAFAPATLQRRALAFVPSFEGLPERRNP